MKFILELDEKEYTEFANNHEKSHFLQSYSWGQFCQKEKGQIPKYVGIKKDDKLIATCLILLRKTPLGYSYGYAPRGPILDYKDKKLIKAFTEYIKKYMKDNKIIYIKFDPDIKYQTIDENAQKIDDNDNNYELYNYMLSLGYIHTGFYKLYEGNQPRYTFRINLKDTWENIENKFSKTFLKSIKRSYNYNLTIDNNLNTKDYYRLFLYNSKKDDFNSHNLKYYQTFTEEMAKNNQVKYFNVSFNVKKYLKDIDNQIKELEKNTSKKKQADINNKIARLNKEKEEFQNIKEDNPVVCSLICVYTSNRAWSLFIGSDNIANTTFAVTRSYYEAIKDAYAKHYDFFDLFGTSGDPHTTYKNLASLHDFKRKFGDEYIEFIGEFDLVNKKFLYKVLPILLKIYRKLRRK